MRATFRIALVALAGTLLPLGIATASAADAPVYGPKATPVVGVSTSNGTATATATGYCANETVTFTIAPATASSELPKSVAANSSGVASVTFTKPAVAYTITASTTSAVDGCTKSASVTEPLVKSAAVTPVVLAPPVAAGGGAAGTLPVTGSDATGMQLRNALVALCAGIGLVAVAGVRRRNSGASVRGI